jgi:hypothetical protein
MARLSCADEVNYKTGRDVGFRLRQAYGATSWAESGFALSGAFTSDRCPKKIKKLRRKGEAFLKRYVRTNYGLKRNFSLPRLAASLAFRRTF